MRFIKALFTKLLFTATFFGLISLLALFSKHHILFDILSHFRIQYLIGLIPMLGVAILFRKISYVLLISICVAVHGYVVAVSYLPLTDVKAQGAATIQERTNFRVLNANLLISNRHYQAQLDHIAKVNPDIIAFQEYSNVWHQQLSNKLGDYPYQRLKPDDSPFGIAVYSKFPIESGGPSRPIENMADAIDISIKVDDQSVRVIAIHPPPPVSTDTYNTRNKLLELVASETKDHVGPLFVAGDLNATQWTAHFTALESNGRLQHARRGFGIHPSWPSSLFLLLVPIDHVLVNEYMNVKSMRAGDHAGSDHLSIITDLEIIQ